MVETRLLRLLQGEIITDVNPSTRRFVGSASNSLVRIIGRKYAALSVNSLRSWESLVLQQFLK